MYTIPSSSSYVHTCIPLEGLCISAHTTAEGKFLTSRGVFHVQGAFCALQGFCTGAHGALGQLRFGGAGHALEIVVAWIAEVGSSETEVDGHRTAVAALVLQEISAMLRTYL